MIRLHRFPPAWGLDSASPFCLKLACWLRMAGAAYEPVDHRLPVGAPKGKLPYVEIDGVKLADSGLIVERLRGGQGTDMDAWLTAEQRAAAHAVRRMVEEHLYWAIVYSRWVDPDGWRVARPAYFPWLPPGLRGPVGEVARAGVRRQLHAQGLGRHGMRDAYAKGFHDLEAVSALLGDKPFLMGHATCSADATLYAFLAHIVMVPVASPLKGHAIGLGNLLPYCRRMHERYFTPASPPPSG